MEMFLMVAAMSFFALAVTAAAFAAATPPEPSAPAPPAEEPVEARPPARFFADYSVNPAVTRPTVPIEALLLQIENHIRLEQAAAESFVEMPTASLLHSKTISPLVQ